MAITEAWGSSRAMVMARQPLPVPTSIIVGGRMLEVGCSWFRWLRVRWMSCSDSGRGMRVSGVTINLRPKNSL